MIIIVFHFISLCGLIYGTIANSSLFFQKRENLKILLNSWIAIYGHTWVQVLSSLFTFGFQFTCKIKFERAHRDGVLVKWLFDLGELRANQ